MGDGSTPKIERIGTIRIKTRSGQNKVLKEVYYVTKFTYYLLSLGQLMEWGYQFNFDNEKCFIGH